MCCWSPVFFFRRWKLNGMPHYCTAREGCVIASRGNSLSVAFFFFFNCSGANQPQVYLSGGCCPCGHGNATTSPKQLVYIDTQAHATAFAFGCHFAFSVPTLHPIHFHCLFFLQDIWIWKKQVTDWTLKRFRAFKMSLGTTQFVVFHRFTNVKFYSWVITTSFVMAMHWRSSLTIFLWMKCLDCFQF